MQDLAETAQAERHPDVILWTLQTEEMQRDREVLIGLAKNRMGSKKLARGVRVFESFDTSLLQDLVR